MTARSETNLRRITSAPLLLGLLLVTMMDCSTSRGLAQDGPAGQHPGVSVVELRDQIRLLDHPSYRTRELAMWTLRQHPRESIQAIQQSIQQANYNTGSQLVELLSVFATHSDIEIGIQARETLQSVSGGVTSVATSASNALNAIADVQERQAIEILLHSGARIGPRDFTLNGRSITYGAGELALTLDEKFRGNDDTIQWIGFIKSIETVYLHGKHLGARHLRAVSQMKGVKNLKIKHTSLEAEDLDCLRNLTELEHLGLSYVDLGDEVLGHLAALPVSASMRLYGTQITVAGGDRLKEQLDGLEIYIGSGGFLGVATDLNNTIINKIVNNSGAQKAGLKIMDKLTHINDVPIDSFEDLRAELGKFTAGDELTVRFERTVAGMRQEMETVVTLGEEP